TGRAFHHRPSLSPHPLTPSAPHPLQASRENPPRTAGPTPRNSRTSDTASTCTPLPPLGPGTAAWCWCVRQRSHVSLPPHLPPPPTNVWGLLIERLEPKPCE